MWSPTEHYANCGVQKRINIDSGVRMNETFDEIQEKMQDYGIYTLVFKHLNHTSASLRAQSSLLRH